MKTIDTTQNTKVALTVIDNLDRTRKWRGETQAIPAIRFELAKKIELGPGRYVIDKESTLSHNLSLDKARLLFFDLANFHFSNEEYPQVIFRNDNGHQVNKSDAYRASMFTATYRHYQDGGGRIVLEVWEGPGAYDHKMNWVYPLDKDQHAIAILLDVPTARQMALKGQAAIQRWETITILREYGVIPNTETTSIQPDSPKQLALPA